MKSLEDIFVNEEPLNERFASVAKIRDFSGQYKLVEIFKLEGFDDWHQFNNGNEVRGLIKISHQGGKTVPGDAYVWDGNVLHSSVIGNDHFRQEMGITQSYFEGYLDYINDGTFEELEYVTFDLDNGMFSNSAIMGKLIDPVIIQKLIDPNIYKQLFHTGLINKSDFEHWKQDMINKAIDYKMKFPNA